MRLIAPGSPLTLNEVTLPPPAPQQLLIRVQACGVCRTDLHLVDNELPDVRCPDMRSSGWSRPSGLR